MGIEVNVQAQSCEEQGIMTSQCLSGSKKSTKKTKSINGSLYIFRGQINTEVMEVEIVEDGTADYHSNGYTVTNDWKIHNMTKNKLFMCMAKMAEEKCKWLDTIICKWEQCDSLKMGVEPDTYIMIAEKGEKLYHLMMSKKVNLIEDQCCKLSTMPKEEDYGFDIEENKAMVVKSVQRGLLAEVRPPGCWQGLCAGGQEDVLQQGPGVAVALLCGGVPPKPVLLSRHPLCLVVATKVKETIKVPDHPEVLCFQIPGATPPCVYTLGRGSEAVAAGLSASQCILKVNCSSVASEGDLGVLDHFWAFRSHSQEALLSLWEDVPVVNLMVDSVDLEPGVLYEYMSTMGIQWHVPERILESRGCIRLTAKILEAFAADDSAFMQNCVWLMAMSSAIVITSHYDLRNICDTKLESINQRIACYQQDCPSPTGHPNPVSYIQHCITTVTTPSWKCLPVVNGVHQGQTLSDSSGPVSGAISQEDWGLSSLLKQEDHEVKDTYLQLFTKLDVALKEMKHYFTQINSSGPVSGAISQEDWGLSSLLKQEDHEVKDTYLQLFTKLDVALKEMKHYFTQINRVSEKGSDGLHGVLSDSDTIKVLLKGPVMGRAFEETKHFPMEHSLQDRKNQLLLALLKCADNKVQLHRDTVFCQALVATMCIFSKQLLVALSYCYNNNGMYEESSRNANGKWLEIFYLEWSNLPTDASITAMKTDQLIHPINALDELCCLMKSFVHPKPGTSRSLGSGLIPVSSVLCYCLQASQITICSMGMLRWAAPGPRVLGSRDRKQEACLHVLDLLACWTQAGPPSSGPQVVFKLHCLWQSVGGKVVGFLGPGPEGMRETEL
ncbi:Phosphatidylinositol 3,4,5-trisphosphate-dependent Rac exchanger 1 protein [Sciurus carolinensis]|uniref:Phosphatidylinositol 3,4,5-trisphosphate-dependent Rac exchanger 1 protein n=1 Tax=Sciurus carolinensis TaxID=30640 RepID=A0AA41N708_SCICA|nr:Phosphatidylinositol 3,4,5-trisphosphate-dependent Rac exchanger 1 protein [Sciurus carolinensis]